MPIIIGLLLCAALVLIAVVIRRQTRTIREDIIRPCGFSINQIKQTLEKQSHCGKYWGMKAYVIKSIVIIKMEGNELLTYDYNTGEGIRTDYEESSAYPFRIVKTKEGLEIRRLKK